MAAKLPSYLLSSSSLELDKELSSQDMLSSESDSWKEKENIYYLMNSTNSNMEVGQETLTKSENCC